MLSEDESLVLREEDGRSSLKCTAEEASRGGAPGKICLA